MMEESSKSTFSPVYNKDIICEHFEQLETEESSLAHWTSQSSEQLFYTDREAHEVVCVHPAGHTLFKFSSSSKELLRRPTGIAYD
ncbi:unnamed protein product [Orchesella dallaii]|uniref:Uncharacterized protein n=1 Tax=Orchesella dallaii TaxID=48710 RepID=A0ABP1PVA1_9HEXA